MISKRKMLKLLMKIFLMATVVFLKASPLECSLIQKIWKNNCIESTFLEENELVTAKLFRWLNADILSQLMKSVFCLLYRQKWKRWPKAITTIVTIIRSKLHLPIFHNNFSHFWSLKINVFLQLLRVCEWGELTKTR